MITEVCGLPLPSIQKLIDFMHANCIRDIDELLSGFSQEMLDKLSEDKLLAELGRIEDKLDEIRLRRRSI